MNLDNPKYLRSNGLSVRWKLPLIDLDAVLPRICRYLPAPVLWLKDCPVFESVISFLAKFTNLELEKMDRFLDTFNLFEAVYPLINHMSFQCSSFITETGFRYGCTNIYGGTPDMDQNHDFIFLLLKCKYKAEQCERIYEYYARRGKVHFAYGGLLEFVDSMTLSDQGEEPSSYNFIKDVQLDPKDMYEPMKQFNLKYNA